MKKRILALSLMSVLIIGMFSGCSLVKEKTISETESTNNSRRLHNGQYYVWHDENEDDIENDLNKTDDDFPNNQDDIFRPIYAGGTVGDSGYMKTGNINRLFYTTSDNEYKIPTLYAGDKLLYYNETEIPREFLIERMRDDGYSLGAYGIKQYGDTNLYAINTEDEYAGLINVDGSGISAISANANSGEYENIFFKTIGETVIDSAHLTDFGTITGLKKDGEYTVEYSLGTIQHQAILKSSIHYWNCMECFYLSDITFITDNLISIEIPDYFKTGYYYINGVGVFRYIADGDNYNDSTNYNSPIIIVDENGSIVKDPSSTTGQTETESSNQDNNNGTGDEEDVASETRTIEIAENQTLQIGASYSEQTTDSIVTAPYVIISTTVDGIDDKKISLVNGDITQIVCNEDFPAGKYTITFYNLTNHYTTSEITCEIVNEEEE
jgi:hypothetical protein